MLRTVERRRLVYLVQEDERRFYSFGDDRLRAAETMSEPNVFRAINSELLFRHLTEGPAALPNIADGSMWFEPAFPSAMPDSARKEGTRSKRRRFAFYARPNNFRNLYWRGLEAISAALEQGIIDPETWEIHFIGKDMPDLLLPCGVRPVRWSGLAWAEYQELMSSMDAGLALMDAPYPSYPPLDLAAVGTAVLTNTHPGKDSLEHYSKNIFMAEPTLSGLTEGLQRVVDLGLDDEQRAENRQRDGIARDWTAALGPVVERVYRHLLFQEC
jgi:hypothetical protein